MKGSGRKEGSGYKWCVRNPEDASFCRPVKLASSSGRFPYTPTSGLTCLTGDLEGYSGLLAKFNPTILLSSGLNITSLQ